MKKSHLYLSIFVISWVLLIGGVILGYMYASTNMHGTKITKVKNFDSLPKNIKMQYVRREDVADLSAYMATNKTQMILANDDPIEGSNEELQAQIRTLREKNQALYQDNVNLSDKSWELAQKLQDQKRSISDEKRKLRSKNIETINEAEQQHYKNVNDLTKRINELQQEAIDNTKNYEGEIIKLEDEVESLKQALQKKDFEINEEISVATKKERISNSTLAEKNRYLLNQMKTMKDKLQKQMDESAKNMKSKKDIIAILKERINERDAQKNIMLTKHTKEILQMDQKNASVLRELRQTISKLQTSHKEEITKKNQELANLIIKQKQEVKSLKKIIDAKDTQVEKFEVVEQKNKQQSQDTISSLQLQVKNLSNEKDALQEQLRDMELRLSGVKEDKGQEYENMLKEVKQSLKNERANAQKNIEKLEYRILQAADIIDDLKLKNTTLSSELEGFKNNTQNQMSKSKYDENEKKHAQNYKILNEKIANLENDRKKIFQEANAQISQMEQSIKKKSEQIAKESEQRESKIASLENKIATLISQNNGLKSDSTTHNQKLENELKETSSKLQNAMSKLENLNTNLDTLRGENANLSRENDALKINKDKNTNSLENKTKEIKESNDRIASLEAKTQKLHNLNIKLTQENDLLKTNSNEKIGAYEQKYNQASEKLIKSENKIVDLNKEIATLRTQNSKLNSESKSYKNSSKDKMSKLELRYKSANDTLRDTQNKIMQLKDQLDFLQKENASITKENDTLRSGKKQSKQSYEDRLSVVKKTLELTRKKAEDLSAQNMSLKGDIAVLEKKNRDLNTKNSTLAKGGNDNTKSLSKLQDALNDLRNRRAEIMALKNSIKTLKSENELLKNQSDTLKTIQAEKSNTDELQKELAKLKDENSILKDKNSMLTLMAGSSKAKPSKSSVKKLELVDTIKCDDMPRGTNDATAKCKTRVKKFLNKYNAGYFYEVVPIVDNGGFASLKKVQRSKIGIANSEIERLTRLSNIGLGKDRARSGGKLIENRFGDLARISYSNGNMDIPKKRGFVIRVYE